MTDTKTYHDLVQRLRRFFIKKGFFEVATQSRLSILAACENPFSIATFEFDNNIYPLPQTGQMQLEKDLLENPNWDGVFCISTSYRDEKDPIEGRHVKVFPMVEFESKGNMYDLLELEEDLLYTLGFEKPIDVLYEDMCIDFGGIEVLEDGHEHAMWKNLGNVISLQKFPLRTSPFWNMKHDRDYIFNKVDVVLFGQETIGSAERSTDANDMKKLFYSISDGEYSNKLFELFGQKRVEEELDQFLSYNFFPRYGGGIGMTRLARAHKLNSYNK